MLAGHRLARHTQCNPDEEVAVRWGWSIRTLIEFTIRRTLSEDQEIYWLETVSGQRGYVAFENGQQEFEMKDNEHVLHNDFPGYDCIGDACRKRRHGNNRRQSARRASDEVRINLLGVCR